MRTTTKLFAIPLSILVVGSALQSAGAETYSYMKTYTTSDSPKVVETVIESPVVLEKHPMVVEPRPVAVERWIAFGYPVLLERPVVIKRKAYVEGTRTVVESPVIIKDSSHRTGFGVLPAADVLY